MQKMLFLHLGNLFKFVVTVPKSGVPPWESSGPELSENVVLFGCRSLQRGVIAAQSQQFLNFGSVSKIKRCHKKKSRAQFWFFGSAMNRRSCPPYGVPLLFMAGPKNQNCGRVFFLLRLLWPNFFLKFDLTLTANNSPLKSRTPKKYHIFGILRTSAFLWSYPGYGTVFDNLE